MTAPDRDIRELLRPLRAAEPSDERPHEALDHAIEQASASLRRRRGWKRRLGPPTGLVVGLLVVSTAAATATGVISFGGLAETTSRDDASAPKLRAFMGALTRQARAKTPVPREIPELSGRVTREGLDIEVTVTERRVCILAPGHQVVGRDYDDLRGHPDVNRTTDLPTLDETQPARELLRDPHQFACVTFGRLEEQLPAIFGSKDHRSWVVVLAPDQIAEVRATTADGQTVVLANSQNLAVGRATSRFTRIQWLTADGRRGAASPTPPAGATTD